MNRIYRSIWSAATGCWVAVQESARARGKGGVLLSALAVAAASSGALDDARAALVLDTEGSPVISADSCSGTTIGGSGLNYFAMGCNAYANDTDSMAIGTSSVANGVSALAFGDHSNALADGATVLGGGATAGGVQSVALGGDRVDATQTGAAKATGARAVAVGASTLAQGDDSLALGSGATAAVGSSVAIGNGAKALVANSVALGSGAATSAAVATASGVIGGKTYDFAGVSPTGVVSVGAKGAERQVTNVAAGQITSSSTDAVNGSQLNATNTAVTANTTAITALQGQTADAVMYESSAHDSVTLGGVDANTPVALHNVASGALTASSTDAVNGS
ncbi:ESPR-type extended signal peptide-containing protein, partial [Paraburkholderia tropica]|uniref:ESPR-type extended signal peptide-containing protein n=1 Tax=Paraburkholderia tropica TaxID=92647 RepID=UPI0025B652FD